MNQDDRYSSGEAARELRVSRESLIRWIHEGRVQATRTAIGFPIKRNEIERLRHERSA